MYQHQHNVYYYSAHTAVSARAHGFSYTHNPCSRAVNTGREHGWQNTPVFTAREHGWLVNTGSVYRRLTLNTVLSSVGLHKVEIQYCKKIIAIVYYCDISFQNVLFRHVAAKVKHIKAEKHKHTITQKQRHRNLKEQTNYKNTTSIAISIAIVVAILFATIANNPANTNTRQYRNVSSQPHSVTA